MRPEAVQAWANQTANSGMASLSLPGFGLLGV